MEPRDDVTVVIAAKDEAPAIGPVLAECRRHVRHVIVVDGHSTDDTAAIARSFGARVLLDRRRGKGDALRAAIGEITTDITVFLDADGSHDPADIPRLIRPILDGTADHVSGSRLIGGSSELHGGFDELCRLTGSSLITACINWRFGVRLSESQNGFRAIRTAVLRTLDLREDATTIEQEMIIKTLRLVYRMGEVPAHEHPRRYGASHIVIWRAAPRYLFSLVWYLFLAPKRRTPAVSVAAADASRAESPGRSLA
jgi:dolichol-phosphate mannosyltransferase